MEEKEIVISKEKLNEILEQLESDIIFYNIRLVKEPKAVSSRAGSFIQVGKISLLEDLGVFDYKTAAIYTKIAKGFYKKEIFNDYENASLEDELGIQKYVNIEKSKEN